MSDSARKRRRINLHENREVELQDIDEAQERQRLREEGLSKRTPDRRTSYRPTTTGYIAVGGLVGQTSLAAPVRPLSQKELQEMFDQCLRLSSENRITTRNSWELKLIDYLREVMENTMSQQNSNFHTASCTIDASMKIYINRVASLAEESFRMVSSLTRSDGTKKQDKPANEDVNEPTEKAPKKVSHAATLEANVEALNVKNVEAQFDLDPLFRITSSKFDAGGASGLLLNNLSIGTNGVLMLDSTLVDEEWENDLKRFEGTLSGIEEDDDVNEQELLPELPGPLPENPLPHQDTTQSSEMDMFDEPDMNDDPTPPIIDSPLKAEAPPTSQVPDASPPPASPLPADPDDAAIEQADDLVASMIGENGGGMYSFFDQEKLRQAHVEQAPMIDEDLMSDDDSEVDAMDNFEKSGLWTGPWKFTAPLNQQASDPTKPQAKDEKKKKREAFKIEFEIELTAAECKAFEAPKDIYSTLLKRGKERVMAAEGKLSEAKRVKFELLLAKGTDAKMMLQRAKQKGLYLSDEKHFELDSLFHPFTRPSAEWSLKERRQRKRELLSQPNQQTTPVAPNVPAEPEPFPDADMEDMGCEDGPPEADMEDDTLDISAAQQQSVEPALRLSLSPGLMQGASLADINIVNSPEALNVLKIKYAKVAKHVDIKRMKDCMWQRIKAHLSEAETMTFGDLIESMRDDLCKIGNPDEVTVPFYFISLLHLTNEHSLHLQGSEQMDSLSISLPNE
eukprot:NODE_371_length_2337_cov_33.505430_g346_i0.p1 GENE.NODE_371_length_2337_cov_33.505430_g346_i0~~NODE_371_length_2337_cov_33.505430_g346_i0.p1  ORF type:complete len:762 (-),score=230.88 NODE_371_length_2337_cov_33.505430_g346_i0:50-2257(-)